MTTTTAAPNYAHDALALAAQRWFARKRKHEQAVLAYEREAAALHAELERLAIKSLPGCTNGIDYEGGDPIELYFEQIHGRVRLYADGSIDVERLHVLQTAIDPFSLEEEP